MQCIATRLIAAILCCVACVDARAFEAVKFVVDPWVDKTLEEIVAYQRLPVITRDELNRCRYSTSDTPVPAPVPAEDPGATDVMLALQGRDLDEAMAKLSALRADITTAESSYNTGCVEYEAALAAHTAEVERIELARAAKMSAAQRKRFNAAVEVQNAERHRLRSMHEGLLSRHRAFGVAVGRYNEAAGPVREKAYAFERTRKLRDSLVHAVRYAPPPPEAYCPAPGKYRVVD
jgi:hypothetical protein